MRRSGSIATVLVIASLAGAGGAQGASVVSHPVTDGGPHGITAGPGNTMTVAARDCAYVGRFDIGPDTLSPTIVPQEGALDCMVNEGPFSTVVGPDGKIYFTIYGNAGSGSVGRVNANGTALETVPVSGHPLDLTVGPDGNVWFAVNGPPGQLGRILPGSFDVDEFAVPGGVQGPRAVISGPDGNLYVTGGEVDTVWRVAPASPSTFTPVATEIDGPSFGEVGPDGNLWFTAFEGEALVRLDPGTLVKTVFPIGLTPWDVAFGDDGNAYVTNQSIDTITKFDPDTSAATPMALSTIDGQPTFIDEGPDGHLYAAGRGEDTVYEVTPDQAPPLPDDTDPPETTITKDPPSKGGRNKVKYKFVSDEAGSTFECKLDRKPYKPCTSPRKFKVKDGKHKFKVQATDAAGNVDPTPAKDKFKVAG
jgi:streptogramin lyase